MSEREEFTPEGQIENEPERIPTPEEVRSIFERLIGREKYETVRTLEDEKGLYLWEVTVPEKYGGYKEYGYMRKGRHAEGQISDAAIHVAFFNKDGVPVGGTSVAKYVEGEWVLIP